MLIGITERGDAGVDFSWEDPIRNHEVDAAVLITKCITQKFLEKVLKLHQEGYKIIVHATCTGYGGTELEPNVPNFTTQLTMIKMLLDDGFPAEQIVLRIDPIFPTVNGMRAVRCVLFGRDPRIQRCRISILDEYPHVKERFRNHGWTPIYGNSFQASDEQLKYVAEGNAVNALIQGDVSCGKTITAFLLLIQAAENGFQSAIMAPTVVLASQHYDELLKLLDGTGLKCAFLNGSLKKKEKDDILKKLASGEINIIVGTHSLTEDSVIFKNLGLIVIDEEQRFGVEKREKMREKAMYNPAYVSMSATPIPRTLASVIYGKNVDLFTIQSMPSGRKPVTTLYMKNKAIPRILIQELLAGRQAYVICPLIEDNPNSEVMANCISVEQVKQQYDRLLQNYGFKSETLTGKMSEKEMLSVLNDFKTNKIQILISTTVVEVGVNNPNATVIVIQNAERFGLSSLHQLRGRVRRGNYAPYCILQSEQEHNERIEAMCQTENGFELSKLDMQIRKTGDILGTAQSGENRYISLMENYPKSYMYAEKLAAELYERKELDHFLEIMDKIKGIAF